MKNNNNYIKIFLTLFICISAHGKTKFTDRQVATMIPKYFARDHNAPKITRTRVYGENGKKVLHLNIEVNRNAYGRQIDSFVGEINFSTKDHSFLAKAPFIRAPRITKISDSVEVLGKCQNEIVAIKSGIHIGLTFLPELSDITFFHKNIFLTCNISSKALLGYVCAIEFSTGSICVGCIGAIENSSKSINWTFKFDRK